MNQAKMESLCAVVVLFRCRSIDSPAIKSASAAATDLGVRLKMIVVDNSPETESDVKMSTKTFPSLDITSTFLPNNPGLAVAYNCALRVAMEKNATWLLVLDQDSSFQPNFLKEVRDNLAGSADVLLPLVFSHGRQVSPFSLFFARKWAPLGSGDTLYCSKQYFAINSGMTVRISILRQLEGYDERLFLYGVDSWLCNRITSGGWSFRVLSGRLEHHLSELSLTDEVDKVRRHELYVKAASIVYENAPLTNLVDAVLQTVSDCLKVLAGRSPKYLKNTLKYRFKNIGVKKH